MTFYIRPRQDFSLARFSKILYALYREGVPHNTSLIIDPDKNKTEVRIEVSTLSRSWVEMFIKMISEKTDCNESDFKIVEVNE